MPAEPTANPLADTDSERPAPPAVFVIFGASGDLTSRKLMPAIENLALRRLLPGGFSVVGVARTEMSDEGFHQLARESIQEFGRSQISDEEWEEMDAEATKLAQDSVEFAKQGTDPKPEDALKNVYA